jgi:uncharacterized protein YbjQ (UPF0145 family)
VGNDPPDELDRVRQESIARLKAGKLPVEAERRLQGLRGRKNFFTSDLTVSEFALGLEHGLHPVSQVMGSCVYHATGALFGVRIGSTPGYSSSEPLLAKPWNEARRIALRRLTMEAAECGADAVIGVHIHTATREFAAGSVEFQAFGTAVRIDGARSGGRPVLCALSGQEYWQLRKAACEIAGLVAATEVVWTIPSVASQQGQAYGRLSSAGYSNREVEEFSRGTQRAVQGAVAELRRQAEAMKAHGIVGVVVEHEQRTVERENPDRGRYYGRVAGTPGSREDLVVTAHAIGTAIVERERPPREARPKIEPVRRLNANRRNT